VRTSIAIALLALAAACLPAAAAAAPSRSLWTTVNICDTASAPNGMGVRANMPGNGTRQRMYVRFTAQYYSSLQKRWLRVRGSGRSPWLYAGPARYAARQAGWTFGFAQPASSHVFLVRAVATFEWRELRRPRGSRRARWVVAIRRRRVTRGGISGVDGADPPGTSRASCYIS
jgi:hypothetical protein